MRELKFRAWDEKNKIMHNDFKFISSGCEGNDWIIFESDKEKRIITGNSITFSNLYFRKQLKIMQFTGLKDKNGTDIFEGDIIQYSNSDETSSKLLVTFDYGMFYAVNDDLWHYISKNAYNIIGNKFENPELLNCD